MCTICLQPNFFLLEHHHKLECHVKNWIAVFKVKVTAKVWNFHKYLSGWYLLNDSTFFNQTWYGGVLSWVGVSCRKNGLLSSRSMSQQRLARVPKHQLTNRNVMWKKHWITVLKVRGKLQNVNECLSRQHPLNYWTFHYQTWYSDKSSWAGVKRLVCCLQGQGHSGGFIRSNYDILQCLLNCWPFCI